VGARRAGVAGLHRAQEAFLGREEGAAAVDVDGAAFENDPAADPATALGELGLPLPAAEKPREPIRDGIVALPVPVLRPAGELPIDERDVAVLPADEERAEVACPRAIGRDPEEVDPVEVHVQAAEDRPCLALVEASCTNIRTRSPGTRWRTTSP